MKKINNMKQELWKYIPDVEGYIVSNTGKVMSLPKLGNKLTGKIKTNGSNGKLLKPRKQFHGYWQVGLTVDGKKKFEYVHRLVAKAFLKTRRGCDIVMHKDDNPSNNHVSNLKWGTPYQNSQMITTRKKVTHRSKIEINRVKVSDMIIANMKNYKGTMVQLYQEVATDLGLSNQYVMSLWYHNNPYKVNVNKMTKQSSF
jgi:hypothetical protein